MGIINHDNKTSNLTETVSNTSETHPSVTLSTSPTYNTEQASDIESKWIKDMETDGHQGELSSYIIGSVDTEVCETSLEQDVALRLAVLGDKVLNMTAVSSMVERGRAEMSIGGNGGLSDIIRLHIITHITPVIRLILLAKTTTENLNDTIVEHNDTMINGVSELDTHSNGTGNNGTTSVEGFAPTITFMPQEPTTNTDDVSGLFSAMPTEAPVGFQIETQAQSDMDLAAAEPSEIVDDDLFTTDSKTNLLTRQTTIHTNHVTQDSTRTTAGELSTVSTYRIDDQTEQHDSTTQTNTVPQPPPFQTSTIEGESTDVFMVSDSDIQSTAYPGDGFIYRASQVRVNSAWPGDDG